MLIIGLYTSRVLLLSLGVVDYGLYNVVGGVIIITNVLTVSVSSAGIRFLTYYLGKYNGNEIRQLFGNLLTVYITLAAFVFVLGETIGLWLVVEKLSIPIERYDACLWVYHLSVIAAVINIISLPYNSVIIAHERMSAFAYITIIDVILKLLIVYALPIIPYDKLVVYSFLILLIQILDRIVYGVYCSHNFLEVHVLPLKDFRLIKKIITYSLWATIGGIGYMGYTQGLNILLNIFFGPAINAARAISVQIETKSRGFSENFQLAVKPQIIKNYASHNFDRVRQLVVMSSKYSFFLVLLVALPMYFEVDKVLSWWLIDVPKWTAEFVKITLGITAVRVLAEPLFQVIHAEGNIRNFQVIEGTILILILPICYILLKIYDVSPIIPYYILLILELVAQCVRMAFALPLIKFSINDYFCKTLLPIVSSSFFSLILILTFRNLFPILYHNLLLGVIFELLCTICVFYFIGCNRQEQSQVQKRITNFILKVT